MYYLYRHIRLDKNEIFYIGIGTFSAQDKKYNTYTRAYSKANRSKLWNIIFNKTKYEIEIVLESDNLLFIKDKEIEFIKIYGRIDLKTGTLVNLTDGGDGINGAIRTKEWNKKISLKNKNNPKLKIKKGPMNILSKIKLSESHKKRIKEKGVNIKCIENLDQTNRKRTEEWKKKQSLRNTGSGNPFYNKSHTEETKSYLSLIRKQNFKNCYIPPMKNKKVSSSTLEKIKKADKSYLKKSVLQYDLEGNFIKKWETTQETIKFGFNLKMIYQCCSGFKKSYKGFVWKR